MGEKGRITKKYIKKFSRVLSEKLFWGDGIHSCVVIHREKNSLTFLGPLSLFTPPVPIRPFCSFRFIPSWAKILKRRNCHPNIHRTWRQLKHFIIRKLKCFLSCVNVLLSYESFIIHRPYKMLLNTMSLLTWSFCFPGYLWNWTCAIYLLKSIFECECAVAFCYNSKK